MKKNLLCLNIFLLILTGTLFAQNTWVQKADFAGRTRYGSIAFSIGDKGYLGSGNAWGMHGDDFWEYNPSTDSWTQKATIPETAGIYGVGFAIGNKGYIGTGMDENTGTPRKDFWEYNPSYNTWTRKADFGGTARFYASGFSIGTKGYVGTGYDGNWTNDFWEYDPALDTWRKKSDFPGGAVTGATGLTIGNKGYLGTGYVTSYGPSVIFWQYDPTTDNWSRKKDFPGSPRYWATGFTIGNKGYIGTGYGTNTNDFWEYDPSNDNWLKTVDLPGTTRADAASFSIGNKAYVGTGFELNGAYKNDFWEYTPANSCDKWTSITNFPEIGRYGSVAIGLNDKGYIGLGAGDNGIYNDFWEYEPLTKTWTQKANFPGAPRLVSVIFGINDKAYVGTGITSPYTLFNDFYEYTPSTNTWVRKADYPGGGRYTAMAFSIGDKGYVGAGKDNGFTYGTNDFYEYDPATDSWTRKANIGDVRRSSGVGFSIGNKGYIGLGFQDYDTRRKDLLEYDPATDTWTQKADLPATERYASMSFTMNDKGYIAGGYYYTPFNDLWAYSPATDSWEQKESMPNEGTAQGIGLTIGNKGYIGFGYASNITYNTLWEYGTGLEVKAPAAQKFCYNTTKTYSIPLPELISSCTIGSAAFAITGATTRSGSGLNASGLFETGKSIVTWTIKDNSGTAITCETSITINAPLSVTIPNTYPLLLWGDANTIYKGFGPTGVTLIAFANGGTKLAGNRYSYAWSNGASTPFITVSPSTVGTHTYTVTITDSVGCTVSASKTITVIDVRCGQAMNKVIICRASKNGNNEFCVTQSQAILALFMGAHLGNCNSGVVPGIISGKAMEEVAEKSIAVFPNPNSGVFTVILKNIEASEIRIIDQSGRIVSQKKIQGSTSNNISFQIPKAAKGMYMIQAISKEGVFTCKMMMQ